MNANLLVQSVFVAVFSTSIAFAQVTILGDTTGSNNFTTADFYGVTLSGAPGLFIESVSWSITADVDAFFDFDGGSNFGDALGPVLNAGSLIGIAAADISFEFSAPVGGDATHPAILSMLFAPGSFGAGDSFRFAADTDFFVTDPAPGSVFGDGAAVFSARLQGGPNGSIPFSRISATRSEALLTLVPEPSSFALLAIGLMQWRASPLALARRLAASRLGPVRPRSKTAQQSRVPWRRLFASPRFSRVQRGVGRTTRAIRTHEDCGVGATRRVASVIMSWNQRTGRREQPSAGHPAPGLPVMKHHTRPARLTRLGST